MSDENDLSPCEDSLDPDESQNDNKPDDDYRVGYGCPPKHTQFRKGDPRHQNRRKPKKKQTIGQIIEQELARLMPVEEGGRRRMYSMEQLIVRRLIVGGAKGDMKAAKLVMEWRTKFQGSSATTLEDIGQDDAAIIDAFFARSKLIPEGGG